MNKYSLVDFLGSQGKDFSYAARKKLAISMGISNYKGTADQNLGLLESLKSSQQAPPNDFSGPSYPSDYSGQSDNQLPLGIKRIPYPTTIMSNSNYGSQDYLNPTFSYKYGGPSMSKAKKMLDDGTANGQALTERQKKYFQAVAHGWKPKQQEGGFSPYVEDNIDDLDDNYDESFMKKGGWIQSATKGMRKDKPCTGSKFGSSTCPPGSKKYNLAKTFKKMSK